MGGSQEDGKGPTEVEISYQKYFAMEGTKQSKRDLMNIIYLLAEEKKVVLLLSGKYSQVSYVLQQVCIYKEDVLEKDCHLNKNFLLFVGLCSFPVETL